MLAERWQEIESLYLSALERPPADRQSYLEKVCRGDEALLREVESLLANHRPATNFLETQDPEGPELPVAPSMPAGARIGPYLILEFWRAGGMGELYKARDTRLDRTVALKFLPSASDPAALHRFEREARAASALNHPRICTVYDVGDYQGRPFIVMEFLEGESLRERIAGTALPMADLVNFARQICDGLQAAHTKGIVHRDVKPGNISVGPAGEIKILDFGLAKFGLEPAAASLPAVSSEIEATKTRVELTGRGAVMGTLAYLSPEQARGDEVDSRTDIFSLGAVLYEMATGQRPFHGETSEELVKAILTQSPRRPSELNAALPKGLERIIEKALAKERTFRYQSAEELAGELALLTIRHRRRSALWISGLALLAAAAPAIWIATRHASAPSDYARWVNLTEFHDPVSQPALSPDGRLLTFLRSPSTFFGVGQVYVKSLPDGEPQRLTNDNLAKTNPEFSPDGTRIVYTTFNSEFAWDTWAVSARGGEPQRWLRNVSDQRGGEPQRWLRNVSDLVWTGRRQILYSERPSKGIVSAGEDLSGRHEIYLPSSDRGVARRPHASPDGKWVLLAELGAYGDWEPCRVVPLDGSSPGWQVGPPGAACTSGAWSPDGRWVYVTSKAGGMFHIWRQLFPSGKPQQVTSGLTEEEGIAIARDGKSFVTAVTLQSASIWLHDSRGDRQISRLEGNAAYAKFTPDGKRVCYLVVKQVPSIVIATSRDLGELWVADVDSGRTEPLVPNFPVHDYDISPDGSQVVMEADDPDGQRRLWVAPLAPRSAPRRIPNVEGRQAVFGPSGEIFFRHNEGQSGFAYRVRPDGTGLRKAIEQPVLAVTGASPDGRWIEGWALLPGSPAPNVQLFPLSGGPPLIVGSNAWLRWSPDGHSVWMQGGPVVDGKTFVIPLPRRGDVPRIPPRGFQSEDEVARLPGARQIALTGAPGPSPEVYAFDHRTIQRNLYRIPIP